MAQDTFATFNAASSSNSTIEGDVTDGSVNVAEGCDIKNINNAVRALAAACNLSFGDLPSGTSRPTYLASGKFWKDTTTAATPIVKYYDGTDDISIYTINTTTNAVTLASGVVAALSDIGDVTITSIASGEILKWNGSAWINNTLAEAGIQATDAELTALAGLTSAADKVPYFTGSGTASVADFSSFGRSLVDDADASAARTTLGLVIGTNVQAYDADLAAIAGLTSAADKAPYYTGSGAAALMDVTAAARTLLDDASTSAMLTTLGATPIGKVAGVNAQTGTTYTVVSGDLGKLITLNNASAIALTIPASVFSAGDWFAFAQIGAGTVTATGDTGVTVNGVSTGGAAAPFRYAIVTVTCISSNTFLMQIDGVA